MNRRTTLLALLALGTTGGPIAGWSQRRKVWRIGFLWGSSKASAENSGAAAAFADGMRKAGYRENSDYVIDARYAGGDYSELEAIARDVVKAGPDIIVTTGAAATQAVQKLTTTTPVVFAIVNDASGFVKSLARPGGNLTGLTRNTVDISPKHLELLKLVVPSLGRVGLLANPGNPSHPSVHAALKQAGDAAAIVVAPLDARSLTEIEGAFARIRALRLDAVVVPVDQLFISHKHEIAGLALKHRVPTMYATPDDVVQGGLMSYGPVYSEFFRQSARYIDRIIRGMKPGDLPVEQPTMYELAINLQTARAIGVAVPQSLRARADQIIE